MVEIVRSALADIRAAFAMRNVWIELAREDLADSHRRTRLGPLWQLLNYLLFLGTIILILGNGHYRLNFPAYVASGLVVWLFINEMVSQSATVFAREESFIKGTILPIPTYVLRQTALTAIRAGYALLGTVPVLMISGVTFNPAMISVLPAIALLLVTAPAVAMVFGFAGVVFPDFQFVVSHVMRVLMFATPVFWIHGGEGGMRGALYHWNPLTHFINVVRTPIVEGRIPMDSWIIATATSAALAVAALFILGRFRRQIVFLL